MNRPANITPAPGLGSGNTAFRPPYQTSLGAQSAQPAQSPYGPPRGGAGSRNGFLFSGQQQQLDADPQRQQQQQQTQRTVLQQQAQAMQQHMQQLSLNQQQQSGSGSSSSLPLQSASQDLRDFPALGSNGLSISSAGGAPGSSITNASSYATQAGTAAQVAASALGIGAGGTNGVNGNNVSTGFGPDDFPALGQGDGSSHGLNVNVNGNGNSGNPNLTSQELAAQHRQSLLGSLPTGQQQRNTTPSSEAQQRQLAQQYQMLKGFPQKDSKTSLLPLQQQQQQYSNWNHAPSGGVGSQPGSHASSQADLLGPPPGVGIPNSSQSHLGSASSQQPGQNSHLQSSSQQQQQPQSQQQQQAQQSYTSSQSLSNSQQQHLSDLSQPLRPSSQAQNQTQTNNGSNGNGNGNGNTAVGPQPPVQQVLTSPADRWGLLGLLAMIRSVEPDTVMLGMGSDLSLAGFDLSATDQNLYSSFITPWSDASASATVEPEYHIPAVYGVHPPVPGPNKAASFSDETLFFMFYSAPRDVLQEVAAQELHNRNWRFHKEIRLWLTKESGTAPSQKASTYERGVYTFFDPESWERVKKDTVIVYDLLEEEAPLSAVGGVGVGVGGVISGTPGVNVNVNGQTPQGQQLPVTQQQQQQQPPPPGMGLLGQGQHQSGGGQQSQQQASHHGQQQPQPQPHLAAERAAQQQQQLHQQQLHQQQLADQIRMQSMNPRYQGTRTPGLGGM